MRARWAARSDKHRHLALADTHLAVVRVLVRLSFERRYLARAGFELLRAAAGPDGRGLPIGNLTSQHFANFYLGFIDRFALRTRGVAAWCRYMDDMVVMGRDHHEVVGHTEAIARLMSTDLGLTEKRAARRVAPVHHGIPMLGFRVWPRRISRLDGARRRRVLRRMRRMERDDIEPGERQRRGTALMAWVAQADSRGLVASRGAPPAAV